MATEKRLIDANALLASQLWNSLTDDFDKARAKIIILSAPTVDAVEVVHARFKFACVHNGKKHYKCTNCHHAFPFANVNHCPNCGAKMDGDGNG